MIKNYKNSLYCLCITYCLYLKKRESTYHEAKDFTAMINNNRDIKTFLLIYV